MVARNAGETLERTYSASIHQIFDADHRVTRKDYAKIVGVALTSAVRQLLRDGELTSFLTSTSKSP